MTTIAIIALLCNVYALYVIWGLYDTNARLRKGLDDFKADYAELVEKSLAAKASYEEALLWKPKGEQQ